jgi:hypothetical protein
MAFRFEPLLDASKPIEEGTYMRAVKMKKFLAIIAASLLYFNAAIAAQNTIVMPVTGPHTLGEVMGILNAGLVSLQSGNSGGVAPTNGPGSAPVLYQSWIDTSIAGNATIRYYDGTGWPSLANIDLTSHTISFNTASVINSQVGTSYTFVDADRGKMVDFCNASPVAVSLPAPTTTGFISGWIVNVRNNCAGTVTITTASGTIDGVANVPLRQGQSYAIRSNGTNYLTSLGQQPWNATLSCLAGNSTQGMLFYPGSGSCGAVAIPSHQLAIGTSGSPIAGLATGTSGLPLVSQGASADPVWAAIDNTGLLHSSLTIGSTTISLGGSASSFSGLSLSALTALGIRSTGSGAFDLQLKNTENLTANHAVTVTTNNADRTINLGGNLTLGIGGDVSFSGGSSLSLIVTGTTTSTFPAGTHTLAAIDLAQTWTAAQTFPNNSLTLAEFPTAGAATFLGNPTASGATPTYFTLQSLTARGAPDATNDKIPILDNATGTLKWVSPGLVAASGSSGVSSLDSVTGAISVQSGGLKVVGSTLQSNVLSSRAFAITQNLSSFSAVKTLGYSSAGDQGEATFVKVSSGTPFTDQYLAPGSYTPTVAGSLIPNGTYLGVPFSGGHGAGCKGQVVVAGGVATQMNTSIPCPGYQVGDVIGPPSNSYIGGTGALPSYTIASIASATGSFTDSVGTLFQIAPGGQPNIMQWGAVHDWNGTDTGTTNNRLSFLSGISYCMYPVGASAANVNGCHMLIPKGAYMYCGGTLPLPAGVTFRGAGKQGGTSLFHCTADGVGVDAVYLCDIYALTGEMGCDMEEISLNDEATSNSGGTRAIYSTAAQQYPSLTNVYITTVNKGCLTYDFGRGGAANFITQWVDCERSAVAGTSNDAVHFGSNVSNGTVLVMSGWNVGNGGGVNVTGTYAINVAAGSLALGLGSHIEEYNNGILIASSGGLSSIRDTSITTGCVNGVTLANSNPNNTVTIEGFKAASCSTASVLNGHSGASSTTGDINGQRIFNP